MTTSVATHIRILALLYLVFGTIACVVSLSILVLCKLAATPMHRTEAELHTHTTTMVAVQPGDEPGSATQLTRLSNVVFGAVGAAACFGSIVGVLAVVSGIGLLRHSSWSIPISFAAAVGFLPFILPGTALGIYALVILFNQEAVSLLKD